MTATEQEAQTRQAVLTAIIDHIKTNRVIKLPEFDPQTSRPGEQYALTSVGIEPNAFGGSVGEFRYQFEGEEDLLHLIVTRESGEKITVEEAQEVAAWLLPELPPALVWLKPGAYSQHFYLAHDHLL